jgi:hypothetical protein
MHVLNAYMVSIRNMRVTSVSNGYVRNTRQACLVPYQVLSGHARTRAIHCLFFFNGKQNKRTMQMSSLVILRFKLLHTVIPPVSDIQITSSIERQFIGTIQLICGVTFTIPTHQHNSSCITFGPPCHSVIPHSAT